MVAVVDVGDLDVVFGVVLVGMVDVVDVVNVGDKVVGDGVVIEGSCGCYG